MKLQILKNKHSQAAASLVEMALLIALIAMIAIPSVSWMGESVESKLFEARQGITGEMAIPCDPGHPTFPDC